MTDLTTWRRDGDAIAAAVRTRIADGYPDPASRASAIAAVIEDIEARRGEGEDDERERAAWADLVHRAHIGEDVFDAVVDRYLADIAGGFDRTVYRAVTGLLWMLLGIAFHPGARGLGGVGARMQMEGPLEQLRDLASTHTLVFAPTHSSNLDSIMLGLSVERAGIPPVVYAAGKHMYRNALLGRILGKLGAYRVDRSRIATLYKDVLKAYTTELLERGFNSVIFPGGTRCRSNEVESQLKLGLLGTTARSRRPVRIVPVTINYQIVVEAETLIRYQLDGRAAERIVGDNQSGGLAAKLRRLLALDEIAVVRFGDPLDPHAPLGEAIVESFRRNTVLFATQLTARAAFDELTRRHATDVHGLMQRPELRIRNDALHAAVNGVVERLRGQPAAGVIHSSVAGASPVTIVDTAFRAWSAGHGTPVLRRRGDEVLVENLSLVYFYANRTSHLR